MILFSGIYTVCNLEKVFLASEQKEDPSFTGDGYVSLAVLYISFAAFMWMVPSIISLCGPKITLIIGTLGFSLFIGSFLTGSAWMIYAGSICCGLGGSMIWTTQENYMIRLSSGLTLTRNLAIFILIWQSSMVFGNIISYLMLKCKDTLDKDTRTTVTLALLGISLLGTVFFLFLPSPVSVAGKAIKEDIGGPFDALRKTLSVAKNKHMLILYSSFVYMGLQTGFATGVFGACVGFTKNIEHSEQLVPLIGLMVGVGEILSQFGLIMFGKQISAWKYGHTVIMLLALFIEYITLFLVLINFPHNSVFGLTEDPAFISTRWSIAVISGILIGITDGINQCMLTSIIGKIFPNDSVHGCAMFTFVFSSFTALDFFGSNYVGLYWQLLILAITGTLGAGCYIYVSIDLQKQNK